MTDNFLSKFVGKTQTISKLGPEQLLKGAQKSIIYTNTRQSFDRFNFHIPKVNKPIVHDSTLTEPNDISPKDNFHLPHLDPRYLNSQSRIKHKTLYRNQNAKVYYDKETNWAIQESETEDTGKKDKNEQEKIQKKSQPIRMNSPKEDKIVSHLKKTNKQNALLIKSSKKIKNMKLGGLGPNIGGQEWSIRREKVEKAYKYANELKKMNRKRLLKYLEDAQYDVHTLRV